MPEAGPVRKRAGRLSSSVWSPPGSQGGPQDEQADVRARRRRQILLVSLPILAVAGTAYISAMGGRSASTDIAVVKQNVVTVDSDVAGRIVEVRVRENQPVKAGDILFVIDPEPYQLSLAQAEAQIASAEQVLALATTDVPSAGLSIKSAEQAVARTRQMLNRHRALMKDGFTTRARLRQAEDAYRQAVRALSTARSGAARPQDIPGSTGTSPDLAMAQAEQGLALRNLDRTVVRAPISGRISEAARLQIGQTMSKSSPAFSIVEDGQSWVEARFRETDLARMRPGQQATIRFKAYPDLKLKGHVESIGAGVDRGQETPRVPVRIRIDEASPRQLIAGISADVSVDLRSGTRPD